MATEAWRQAGEVWKVVNSRIILAKLCWTSHGGKHHNSKSKPVNSVCVSAAPPGVQLKFRCELQDVIDAIPHDELLVLLGDFNARVGVLGPDEESWRGVLGKHGLNDRNEAGELLQF